MVKDVEKLGPKIDSYLLCNRKMALQSAIRLPGSETAGLACIAWQLGTGVVLTRVSSFSRSALPARRRLFSWFHVCSFALRLHVPLGTSAGVLSPGGVGRSRVLFREINSLNKSKLLLPPLKSTTTWFKHWPYVPPNFCSRACQLRFDSSVRHSQDSGCLKD
jgi:hypothetical protein